MLRAMIEPVTRVGVVVTFLRMDQPPEDPAPKLPDGLAVRTVPECPVEQYRALYNGVGGDYVWWLRRAMSDRNLAALLRDPSVSIHVLERDGAAAGFYELDRSQPGLVNLSYFGLMPHAVGTGAGYPFLRHAVAAAWDGQTRAVTVNTCTADHPRALATYQRAGFTIVRRVPETWHVPVRLGMTIPDHLKV